MSLMGSLGLENVEADPNNIPDGRYIGKVLKDEYVYVAKDDSVSHVITYQVTGEDHKGAQRAEWFKLGVNPQRDDLNNIVGLDFTMTDQAKSWYKKRLVDLGIPEEQVPSLKPGDLKDIPVNFGVKRNGSYVNVNFAEKRTVTEGSAPASQGGLLNPSDF